MKSFLLIIALSSYVGTSYCDEVRIVNLRGAPASVNDPGGVLYTFPMGVTTLHVENGTNDVAAYFYGCFGGSVPLQPGFNYDIVLGGTTYMAYFSQPKGEENLWVPFAAGTGVGFMWFGFGWILRLVRRIPGGSDF